MSDPKVRHSSSGSSDSESSTDSYESGSCSSGSKGKADYGSLLNQYLANKSNSKDGQNIVETDTELHNIIQRSETIINAGNNRIKRESKQEVNRLNTLDKETNFKVEPVGSNRIKVTVSTDLEPARVFECDRFCPHKGADLLEVNQEA